MRSCECPVFTDRVDVLLPESVGGVVVGYRKVGVIQCRHSRGLLVRSRSTGVGCEHAGAPVRQHRVLPYVHRTQNTKQQTATQGARVETCHETKVTSRRCSTACACPQIPTKVVWVSEMRCITTTEARTDKESAQKHNGGTPGTETQWRHACGGTYTPGTAAV